MDKMLYVAMTGASQNARAQQAHANNLANISTTGFRRDFEQARSMQVFGDSYPARVYAMSERRVPISAPVRCRKPVVTWTSPWKAGLDRRAGTGRQ